MLFKQLCSPVAAITGLWNCVVYRDIRLLKAHMCSCSFSRAMRLPNVLVGVVYANYHMSYLCARPHLRNGSTIKRE